MKTRITLAVAALLVSAAALAADAPSKTSAEQKAMMDKMTQAMTPGAPHAMLTRMAGEWICSLKLQMDPSKPAQESQSTATITSLMDGRYIQEVDTGQWSGMTYNGMGVYGYDNVSGKYVSSLIDNLGTGIMTCVGTADASGKVIDWIGSFNDPSTGKVAKIRMVEALVDDDHHTVELFNTPPDGKKEVKMMTKEYVRKK
jgi:hypothetical protein